ncbi:50S ribosomal protein L30 [Acidobacteria bacterium AH-259-G07]|nr:50S ribosomal protein L30 [Acidobacteria bacterium AH-259-L09]MDA2927976.1 50S ribosomal protein L30 [Acidobacteria bacterium AH-259-G07]MDA2937005.1 50S ribosomal protein L30 [Acidobacteria bacterium AH-259-A15]
MAKKKTIKMKYVRSSIGRSEHQRKVVRGLGLRKLNQIVERPDTAAIRGMVAKVSHLVEIVEGEGS